MTARDTAALAAQVDSLTSQVDRLANVVVSMRLNVAAIHAVWEEAFALGRASVRPAGQADHGAARMARRGGLSLVGDSTPGGIA